MAAEVAQSLLVLPWNDVAVVEQAFAEHGDEIAAVITEPIMGNGGGILPAPGYLERLRELTRAAGALLIFDEVLTGFRVGRECAQGLFGVEPDLTVLAKAVGGGFPVAAVGGTREAMAVVSEGRTMHGGTYNSNPIACAAVIATMAATGRTGFYDELEARGRRLADGLVEVARAGELDACWSGTGALFQLWFAASPPRNYREAIAIVEQSPFPTFQRELLERGILIQPPQEGLFLLSAAHSDDDVDLTLERAAEAMPAVALADRRGSRRPPGRRPMRRALALVATAGLAAAVAVATVRPAGSTPPRARQSGGTLKAAIADNPDHLDTGLSYATEGWETLEATGNGLLTFRKASWRGRLADRPRPRGGDADRQRRRPHVQLPHAHRGALLASGQPRGRAVGHQVRDRAAVPHRLGRRRLLHRHRRRERVREDARRAASGGSSPTTRRTRSSST